MTIKRTLKNRKNRKNSRKIQFRIQDPKEILDKETKLVVSFPYNVDKYKEWLKHHLEFQKTNEHGINIYTIKTSDIPNSLKILYTISGMSVAYNPFIENPSAYYESISGRKVQVPLNLFTKVREIYSEKEFPRLVFDKNIKFPITMIDKISKISGPATLQQVQVGKKIYLIFGDYHHSYSGECEIPQMSDEKTYIRTSITLQEMVKELSREYLKDIPSIDIYGETSSTGYGISHFPMADFMNDFEECMISSDKYTREFSEKCGINFRYHWTDLRYSAGDLQRIGDRSFKPNLYNYNHIETACYFALNMSIYLNKLTEYLSVYFEKLGLNYFETPGDKLDKVFLENYDKNKKFRENINHMVLSFLNLNPEIFGEVFSTGKLIKNEDIVLTPLQKIISKQISQTNPENVKTIFSFLVIRIIKNIVYGDFKEFSIEVFQTHKENIEKALSNPIRYILENTKKKSYRSTEISYNLLAERVSQIEINDENSKEILDGFISEKISPTSKYPLHTEFIPLVEFGRKIEKPDSEILKKLLFMIAYTTAKGKSEGSFSSYTEDFYARLMDLYMLLRMERTYDRPRELFGVSEDEYFLRRPKEVECALIFAGVEHSNFYAQYFVYKGGILTEYASEDFMEFYGSIDNSRLVDSIGRNVPGRNLRCLNIKNLITSLFVPVFEKEEIQIVSPHILL